MGTLLMSVKERRRLEVLGRVDRRELKLIEAAALMGVSIRQAKRLWSRFKVEGDAGLVHRLRGRPSNRRLDESLRERAVALYAAHYRDFGPTLASEYLAARHDLVVDDETLRRWLSSERLWRRRRKRSKVRRRRARKDRFGELVQLDGSHHDWFEGRGPASGGCCLMVMVDDATGRTWAEFHEAETTHAAMSVFRGWALQYGLPREVYPDRHSIYRVNTQAADEQERRTGKRPLTQFGRAMEELAVKLTCAGSPQAKGRVERMNGTLQDRLVKALRIAPGGGISEIEAANAFLASVFLPALNAKFTVAPASETDAHTPVSATELDGALCVREGRVVGKDQCVAWSGRVLQLEPGRVSLSGRKVEVRQGLDGQVTVHRRGEPVPHRELPQRPQRSGARVTLAERVAKHQPPYKPPANHPYRRFSAVA